MTMNTQLKNIFKLAVTFWGISIPFLMVAETPQNQDDYLFYLLNDGRERGESNRQRTYTTEEEEDDDAVFVVVETMPEFPGGTQAMFRFISDNLKYPVIAQENGIQGRVICEFVINKDGSIADLKVVRSAGDSSLDKEAIRLVKLMPKWKPGKQRDKVVRVKYAVPINFKLQ